MVSGSIRPPAGGVRSLNSLQRAQFLQRIQPLHSTVQLSTAKGLILLTRLFKPNLQTVAQGRVQGTLNRGSTNGVDTDGVGKKTQ